MSINKNIDRFGWLAIIWLALQIPVALLIPGWIAWENGPLENTQVVVLLLGVAMSIVIYRKPVAKQIKRFWLSMIVFFSILVGRELSWGRDFFQIGTDEMGPYFIPMKKVPHHQAIELTIKAVIAGTLLSLIVHTPWKKVLRVPVPIIYIVAIAIGTAIAMFGELGWILQSHIASQNLEELSELLTYLLIVRSVHYYYPYVNADSAI